MIKNLPVTQETWVRSKGQEDPLEKGMAHSSILAWRVPQTKEPGGLQSNTTTHTHTHTHTHPTVVQGVFSFLFSAFSHNKNIIMAFIKKKKKANYGYML